MQGRKDGREKGRWKKIKINEKFRLITVRTDRNTGTEKRMKKTMRRKWKLCEKEKE